MGGAFTGRTTDYSMEVREPVELSSRRSLAKVVIVDGADAAEAAISTDSTPSGLR